MPDSSNPLIPALRGPVPLSHLFLQSFLRDGELAVDATCGNGHDTLLLARLVGISGHVWGLDLQPQAIAETARRLSEAELSNRVTLLQIGHEHLAEHVTRPLRVVLFNLGYLPGGERAIVTRPETTTAALKQALQLLAPGGVVLVTVYPGHAGGAEEEEALDCLTASLPPRHFHSWRMRQTNVAPHAPYLVLLQKAL